MQLSKKDNWYNDEHLKLNKLFGFIPSYKEYI